MSKFKEYAHALSVRSDHSIGESTLQIDKIVEKAESLGYQSVAVTDTMSISALGHFSGECTKHGIKPIVGCLIKVVDDACYRPPKKNSLEKPIDQNEIGLKCYVKTEAGLKSLMNLLSKANTPEYFYYHARVSWKDVFDLKDVVITTGDIYNVFHHPDYANKLRELQARFGDDFYVELSPINTPLFYTLTKKALKEVRANGYKAVLSYPVFYENADDADALDVLRAITTNTKVDAPTLAVPFIRDFYFSPIEELIKRGVWSVKAYGLQPEEFKQAVANIKTIADKCEYRFEKLAPCLPHMADDPYAKVVSECKKGWVERFSKPVLGYKPDKSKLTEYKNRLVYELGIIKEKGFCNYFLLVQDLTNWSKKQGFTPSPGRGSSGGSLVAFLMGITQIDPIRFDLLFERFISPARTDLPDVDMDFPSEHRQEVIQYIIDKYGTENVASISNFVSLGGASSLRDVSRLSGLNPIDYACSKQVEKEHGVSLSLEESAEKVPDIAKFRDSHPEIWNSATKLQGCMKNLGQHAAGVIVTGEPIVNRAVVSTRDEKKIPIVCWDKKYVEDWGLIKMDILGLSTLDLFKYVLDFIERRHGTKIDLLNIPLDDPKVLHNFSEGNTVGVFQFESGIMQKLLKDLATVNELTFDDLCAATALNRPGPLDSGLTQQYVAVKQGIRSPYYAHPSLEPVLGKTFGVMAYQEQVMKAVQVLGGLTPTDADGVRRAIGKKNMTKMQSYKDQFITGAEANGMQESEARNFWDDIEKFASYSFNFSHSVSYSVISYWAMYLKTYYPHEFYAGSITIVDDEAKISALVKDAQNNGIRLLPPDINKSNTFVEIDGNDLVMPFQAIKGISSNVSAYIVKAREEYGKPFESYDDFVKGLSAVGLASKVNTRHRTNMNLVGCFASIEPDQKPSTHPSRLKDRLELLPGFTVETVKADRGLNTEALAVIKIKEVLGEVSRCDKCPLEGTSHPLPRFGTKPKFMVVFDSPTWKEGIAGKLMTGDIGEFMKQGLEDYHLDFRNGYFTTLVKAPKRKGERQFSNTTLNCCSEYLKREIEILKPPVIVAMGSNAVRFFCPELKGSSSDLAGKTVYKPELDTSIVCGINPQQVIFDASKLALIEKTFEVVADLVS